MSSPVLIDDASFVTVTLAIVNLAHSDNQASDAAAVALKIGGAVIGVIGGLDAAGFAGLDDPSGLEADLLEGAASALEGIGEIFGWKPSNPNCDGEVATRVWTFPPGVLNGAQQLLGPVVETSQSPSECGQAPHATITYVAGPPPAVGDPVGYEFINSPTNLVEQHNLYRTGDGHIHALWFDFAKGWHHEDRTVLVAGVPPAVGEPFGYAFINSPTGLVEQHNLFRSGDGHIHALWSTSPKAGITRTGLRWWRECRRWWASRSATRSSIVRPGWSSSTIYFGQATGTSTRCGSTSPKAGIMRTGTALVAGVPLVVGEPFGYAFINSPTGLVEQHNLFRSGDGHIHALWSDFAKGWHHEDRTALVAGVPPAVGEPFGYALINSSTGLVEQHNLFRTADGHIHALWFDFAKGWHHEDRTASALSAGG